MQIMAGARFGGAEAFFERMVIALHRAGLSQHVVIRREAARAERLAAAGLAPRELSFGGPFDFATRRALGRMLERESPEIAVVWMRRAAQKTPRSRAVLVGRLGGYYGLQSFAHCDHLIANTQDIATYIRGNGWPESRVHYLPNFVAAARVPPVPRGSLATGEGPLLLALGRLHRNKGFDVLMQALASLPNATLWLAGEGPEAHALRALAQRLGVSARVRFLGWREDTAALMAAADIVAVPSRHEPLGNVVIEAWAQERPVVAAASRGPAALIRDGETGLLVAPEDASALADAIGALLKDAALAKRLAEGGRRAYEAAFTEEKVVTRWLELFYQIAA
jgi:glycosyltransferase involved in cell wall biosynthesis